MGNADSYRDAEVRSVLMPLVALAERTGVAILVLMHLTKDTKAKATQRAMGSVAFVAVPRIVLAVGPDPDDPNPFAPGAKRALGSLKQNICEPATPWAYRTVSNRVDWMEPREDIRVDVLLAGTVNHDSEARQDVEAFLCRFLADGLYQESAMIEAGAVDAGITKDRLFKTRKKLCESRRVGYGSDGRWFWRLKAEFRPEPVIDGGLAPHCLPIPCAPTESANNGHNRAVTSIESATSSLFGGVPNNGGLANNDGTAEWGEI